jgi:hypothetical protein
MNTKNFSSQQLAELLPNLVPSLAGKRLQLAALESDRKREIVLADIHCREPAPAPPAIEILRSEVARLELKVSELPKLVRKARIAELHDLLPECHAEKVERLAALGAAKERIAVSERDSDAVLRAAQHAAEQLAAVEGRYLNMMVELDRLEDEDRNEKS